MWGAFNPGHSLGRLGSVRPAMRWSGFGVVAAAVLIAGLRLAEVAAQGPVGGLGRGGVGSRSDALGARPCAPATGPAPDAC